MNITDRIQHLDDLILQLTIPPSTAQLRNQLSLVSQEIEAHLETLESAAQDKAEAAKLRLVIERFQAKEKKRRFGRDRNGFWNPLGV